MQQLTTRVMGIINVTPDSFSDGGDFHAEDDALSQAHALIQAGADILDIGGESTRPYADPVDLEEELRRTIPVIQAIRAYSSIPISIDTTKAEVARQALGAGADIINDITALTKDPAMIDVAVESKVPVIIMHIQGTPADMQDNPNYADVVEEVFDFLKRRIDILVAAGVERKKIIVDPGIGFGKTLEHNLSILRHLHRFKTLGNVLLGHSRKSFLGTLTGLDDAAARDLPTAVVSALAVQHMVDIIRVHDVSSTRQALQVAEAINTAA